MNKHIVELYIVVYVDSCLGHAHKSGGLRHQYLPVQQFTEKNDDLQKRTEKNRKEPKRTEKYRKEPKRIFF